MDDRIIELRNLLQLLEGTDHCKLWFVISALRGPDNNDEEVKNATTAVIRRHLGISSRVGLIVRDDTETYVEIRRRMAAGLHHTEHHFYDHARKAFEALDLKWDGINPL